MSRRGSVFRQEPLLLFLVVGILVFVAWSALGPRERGTIRVERSVLRALEAQQEELLGRILTEDEREIVRERHIDDEILLREALRRGWHLTDYRVRKRLLNMMRTTLTEAAPDPSVAQLQAYFRENTDKFTRAESVTLEQVYFPWGDEISDEEVDVALAALRAGADAETYGRNSLIVARRVFRQTRLDLIGFYGADFADRIEELPVSEWQGPFESTVGVHLVRVEARYPPQAVTFEDVEPYLRDEWLLNESLERQQQRIDEIRKEFRVELVDD